MTFDDIFSIVENLASQNAAKLSITDDTSVNLNITGNSGGTIGASVVQGRFTLRKSPVPAPDAEITLSGSDFLAVIERRLNPMLAIATGRIKVSGDAVRLMRIIKLLT